MEKFLQNRETPEKLNKVLHDLLIAENSEDQYSFQGVSLESAPIVVRWRKMRSSNRVEGAR